MKDTTILRVVFDAATYRRFKAATSAKGLFVKYIVTKLLTEWADEALQEENITLSED